MSVPLARVWDRLHSGYWFLPTVMVAGAAALAYLTDRLDRSFETGASMSWLVTRSPDGARAILTTAAGSVVTVAGVAFSITVVALALAASQLGSKVLRAFMRDTGNQAALGTFVAAFVYCVLVLRTVRGANGDGPEFVPTLSIAVALLFTLASVGMLIYFLHHVATEIQAERVIAAVAEDLREAVERLYPDKIGDPGPPGEDVQAWAPAGPAARVEADRPGYIQAVDGDRLLKLAASGDLLLTLLRRPGQFVEEGIVLAELRPGARASPALLRKTRRAFELGPQRTTVQDVEFGIDQLTQIAMRALSPGVNDTLTALACMDWLEAELRRYAGRRLPPDARSDGQGRIRVLIRSATPEEVASAAFHPLRRAARGNAAATQRLLSMILAVAGAGEHGALRNALRVHADLIAREAREAIPSEEDRRVAERLHREALAALGPAP